MQLQTQAPCRGWSSAAATSIPRPARRPLMKTQTTRRRIQQRFAPNKTLIKIYEAVLLINNFRD